MDEGRDLVLISIPFVIAAAVGQRVLWHDTMPVLMLTATAALFAIDFGKKIPAWAILYALLGLFCGSCAKNCEDLWEEICNLKPVTTAAVWLRDTIDSFPYSNRASAALVKALLTGDRSDLDKETVLAFREAGASHILALSGLHLGLIHLIIRKVSFIFGNSPAPRLVRAAATMAAAAFYTLMTGASPSTVRALLFIIISEWSRLSSFRKYRPGNVLMLTLMIQTALSPGSVLTLSFQMSYLAMCGIIFVFPSVKKWYPQDGKFAKMDPVRKIWDAVALSISCQLFTAPLAWLKFGTFPTCFILTNVLILPLTSATIIVSLLTVAASAVGICPSCLMNAGEKLVQTMIESLEIISRI